MKEKEWVVGRYLSGNWDCGGNEKDYMDGWTCRVLACDRKSALKKGKNKYYAEKRRNK